MKNSDKPAYPVKIASEMLSEINGLTKREYFAAMAMQGICSHNLANWSNGDIVINAVDIADELLKQLEK